jgi:hypothetical protein
MNCEGDDFGMESVFCDGSELACRVAVVDLKDVGGASVSLVGGWIGTRGLGCGMTGTGRSTRWRVGPRSVYVLTRRRPL